MACCSLSVDFKRRTKAKQPLRYPLLGILTSAMTLRKASKGEGDDQRIIDFGRPEHHPPFADNSVTTSKYSLLSFFPLVSLITALLAFLSRYFLCDCPRTRLFVDV